jgi:hypothetical protein
MEVDNLVIKYVERRLIRKYWGESDGKLRALLKRQAGGNH